MPEVIKEFTNPEVAKRWKPTPDFTWNRRINVPGIFGGPVWDITPKAVEALIKQGRKDFIEIKATETAAVKDVKKNGQLAGENT